MNTKNFFVTLFVSVFIFFAMGNMQAQASATDNVFGEAWSMDTGWISFNNCTNSTTCSGNSYGVTMDHTTGNLSGEAWSSEIGWISFNNSSGCPGSVCQPNVNLTTGAITGFARAMAPTYSFNTSNGGWDGWIGLNATSVGQTGWGLQENTTTGLITGQAWGDINLGWIAPNPNNDLKIIVTPTSAPVVTLTANPTSGVVNVVNPTLTWSATNSPTSCTASGDWSGAKSASGSASQGVLTTVKTYTYTLSCTNAVGTGSATVTVVVTPSPMPDLTASSPVPSSAVAGTPVTFSSTISNSGSATTGASFSNFFQVATASSGSGTITDLAPSTMATLAAGASSTATSPSYTFSTASTYSVRACADKSNSSSSGVIAESNENNNCSATWTNVTVASAPPTSAPVVTLTANPTSGVVNVVNPTLTWSATNSPTSCTASGDWSGAKSASGSASQGVLTTVKTYTYTLSCTNAVGTGSATVTVVVNNATTYTITASSGSNGSVSPNGVTTVNSGSSQSYSILANSGYTIASLTVDGASKTIASSYTFSNVTANHTISATFAAVSVTGSCGITPRHYICSAGSPINKLSGASAWTWECQGSGGGTTATCTQNKPVFQEH